VSDHEAYERMRASLDDAHAEAERLVQEAASEARGVPPRGWASPGSGAESEERRTPGVSELQALVGLIDLARQSLPPELSRQFLDALRQLLLAIRALIDFWLERLDAERDKPPEVEDIPIR
jgi:hypothetical protein